MQGHKTVPMLERVSSGDSVTLGITTQDLEKKKGKKEPQWVNDCNQKTFMMENVKGGKKEKNIKKLLEPSANLTLEI